jgi:ATP-dependent DNA helicase RecG
MIVVEHAERFGLSQLHQLRGRIGRGNAASTAVLLQQPPLTPEAGERLRAMVETNDGFEIAERDLMIRGPGDFFGTRQSGLPLFRVADIIRDEEYRELARKEAEHFLAAPESDEPEGKEIIRQVIREWGGRFGLTVAG